MTDDFDIVFTYTRAQAIEDGVLIDISDTAKEAGIRFPTVVSEHLYSAYIVPPPETESFGQSVEGRLWDVLMVFRAAARCSKDSRLYITVKFLKGVTESRAPQYETATILAMIHPGGQGEPVVSIMLPGDE